MRPLLFALPALLCACPGPGVTDSHDSGEGELVDLWGTVTDPYLHDAPVDGAWVLLDLGDEQLALRTGADGSFSMPGLPAQRPMSVTVAMEGHMAVSYAGLRPGDVTMPLELATHARDLGSYPTETMRISGTISGAPVGSYVMFFGATDAELGTSYLDYVQVGSEEPVDFAVETELILPGEDYALSALAFDGADWIVQAAGAGTVAWGGEESLDLVLDPGALQALAVDVAAPSLDGVAVTGFADEYCSSVAVTHLGESMSTTTGYNRACDQGSGSFGFDLGWAPTEGYTDRLQLYLFDDISTGSYAFGSLPIPDGATSMEVALLDSPVLSHHDELAPGGAVSWEPLEGATGYLLYGYDEAGRLAWYLYPEADATSFTIPRFAADFDTATILDRGEWAVIGRHLVYTDEGLLDQAEAYTGSITHGGQLFL
jgi:hypothetical protein